jgi:hypothetical protein
MVPTYTRAIKEAIIDSFLGSNLVVILINHPSLGEENLTELELEARRSLTMEEVVEVELEATNGYSRKVVSIDPELIVSDDSGSYVDLSVEFTAEGGNMNPFTHIVTACNCDLINADPIVNGNNRGSDLGNIIFVESVEGGTMELQQGLTFEYNFRLAAA